MARVTHAQSIGEVAKTIGENLELVQVVTANSDNIDYGEMIWVDDGTEEGIKTLSDRGIECLQELLADIRTWPGGIIQFLRDEECDPDLIQRIMADEKNRLVQTALGVGLRRSGLCDDDVRPPARQGLWRHGFCPFQGLRSARRFAPHP